MTTRPPADPVQGALELDTVQEGAVCVYRIVFPFLPPSKNQFDNWPPAWRNGHKKKWLKRIAAEVNAQNMPRGVPKIGLAAQLVFAGRTLRTSSGSTNYVRSAPRRDPQNYAQTLWNFVPDGLVQAGLLVDDNEGRIQWGANLGLTLMVDERAAPKNVVEKTIVTIAFEHAKPAQVISP